jgi:hypothetical protein
LVALLLLQGIFGISSSFCHLLQKIINQIMWAIIQSVSWRQQHAFIPRRHFKIENIPASFIRRLSKTKAEPTWKSQNEVIIEEGSNSPPEQLNEWSKLKFQ